MFKADKYLAESLLLSKLEKDFFKHKHLSDEFLDNYLQVYQALKLHCSEKDARFVLSPLGEDEFAVLRKKRAAVRLLLRAVKKQIRILRGRKWVLQRVLLPVAVVFFLILGLLFVYRVLEVAGAGKKAPWRAQYYANINFKGKPVIQYESARVFNWGGGSPHESIPRDKFSVTLHACMATSKAAEVSFALTSDDGSRLYIDDKEVLSSWILQGRTTEKVRVAMEKGVNLLRIEYFESSGGAYLAFSANENISNNEVVFYPSFYFFGFEFCLSHNIMKLFGLTSE